MQLWRWIPGWVRVEAEGGYPARFLNAVAIDELPVWGVRSRGEKWRFCCFARDYRRLRPYARRACVRLRVRQKHGMPFWLFRYRHRKGLVAALCLYVAILALLAPRIWAVQVVGNEKTPTADILAVVQEMGVRIGAPMSGIDKKQLEISGPDRLPTLVWISVNPSGSVARVEVNERKPTPQVLDLSNPSDMVALRDGKVVSMTVVSGKPQVLIGEAVSAGTVLISGREQSELGEKRYRSYGEVWAQTARHIAVSVPLTYYPARVQGYVAVCPTLTFLGLQVPLYAGQPTGDNYIVREENRFWQKNGLTLPLGVSTLYYIRTVPQETHRTEQQAAVLAQKRLAAQEKALFSPGKFTETARKTELKNGVYTLTVEYQCLENIAVEEPIA